jgi:hypothetical protein
MREIPFSWVSFVMESAAFVRDRLSESSVPWYALRVIAPWKNALGAFIDISRSFPTGEAVVRPRVCRNLCRLYREDRALLAGWFGYADCRGG